MASATRYLYGLVWRGTKEPRWLGRVMRQLRVGLPERCNLNRVRQQLQSYVMREGVKLDRVRHPEVAGLVDRAITYNQLYGLAHGRAGFTVALREARKKRRELKKDIEALRKSSYTSQEERVALSMALYLVLGDIQSMIGLAQVNRSSNTIQRKIAYKLIGLLNEQMETGS